MQTSTSGIRSCLGRIRGLIFDCDGVLFDSRDVNRYYYNHILLALGLEPMNAEDEDYVFMHTVDKSLERIIPPELMARARAEQGHMRYEDFLERMIPEPGVHEFLECLERLGVRMGVNTNRKNSMEMVLDRFDMTRFFYPVMTASRVAKPKPDPEGVRVILSTWDMTGDEVAYLGDSSVDQETTSLAGVPFWAYRNPDLQAQLHVDSFHELRQWFERVFAQ